MAESVLQKAKLNDHWQLNEARFETHHDDAVYKMILVASADSADGDTKWAMSITRNSDSKRCFILRYGGAVECTGMTVSELTSGTGSTVVANSSGRLYTSSSSKRYKDYIADMTDEEAEKLYDLPVVQFKYKDGYLDEDDEMCGKPMHGFFAEDVADLFMDGGIHDAEGNTENYSERAIIARLVKIVQKQHEEIEQLKHLIGGAT